jgi:hypothetical protein
VSTQTFLMYPAVAVGFAIVTSGFAILLNGLRSPRCRATTIGGLIPGGVQCQLPSDHARAHRFVNASEAVVWR